MGFCGAICLASLAWPVVIQANPFGQSSAERKLFEIHTEYPQAGTHPMEGSEELHSMATARRPIP